MCIAQTADIFGAGLVAGVFLMGTFAVHPAVGSLDTASHLRLRQELIRRLSKFMPPIMFLPVVASVKSNDALSVVGALGIRHTRIGVVFGDDRDHRSRQCAP